MWYPKADGRTTSIRPCELYVILAGPLGEYYTPMCQRRSDGLSSIDKQGRPGNTGNMRYVDVVDQVRIGQTPAKRTLHRLGIASYPSVALVEMGVRLDLQPYTYNHKIFRNFTGRSLLIYASLMALVQGLDPDQSRSGVAPSLLPMGTDEAHDRKNNARFSRVALQALREWLKSHVDNPYPNEYEKITLAKVTGLKIGQINLWFANARRRRKHLPPTPPSHKIALPKLCVGGGPTSTHTASPQDSTMRIFQCTFCPDTFKTKYDWTRHETSLHLPLKRYICCPFSPIMADPATNAKSCAYCGMLDPTTDHTKTHNHSYCQDRDPETRTFFRKDHLRKHLQSVHESQLLPHMDTWLLEAVFINSRCGICGQRFSIWKERNDHIAAHFKDGQNMDEWKGCRGLDAFISAEVKASMPSFLIGIERSSPNPFSASTMRHEPEATIVSSWEVLAVHLHNLTKRLSERRQVVSDEILQTHARLVVFGSTEAQGLTAANSPEWLDLFKKAHSLDMIPDYIGGEAQCIPEDLEVYQDLGLRIPTSLQEQRQGAMVSLFLSNGPPMKDYRRFSSLDIPLDKALRFETIAGPWPAAGVLGEIFVTREWLLQGALEGQVRKPIASTGQIGEDDSEDFNAAQGLISMART